MRTNELGFKANVPTDEIPAVIADLAVKVAEQTSAPLDWVAVADHTHEEVSEGSWTIALEYDYDWPFSFVNKVPAPDGWAYEIHTGWCLQVYPTNTDRAEPTFQYGED